MNTIKETIAELENEIATPPKPFTAFILDDTRTSEDPLIVHFDTISADYMRSDIEIAYYFEMDCGKNDEEWKAMESEEITDIGDFWQHRGAIILGVMSGHGDALWTPDGMVDEDFAGAFELATPAVQPVADPFLETYRSAWISTAHLTPETLYGLNDLQASGALPYWVVATEYGWIVRFDTLGARDPDDESERWLASRRDITNIRDLLNVHGYQAAHLDADGPLIEGLTEYAH